MWVAALAVTVIFYFVLKAFDTKNIVPSTISVTTSFLSVYLTFRRSSFYTIDYAANDIVLIVLWLLATLEDLSYLSVVVCFVMFLVNDVYGFISWQKMAQRQAANAEHTDSFLIFVGWKAAPDGSAGCRKGKTDQSGKGRVAWRKQPTGKSSEQKKDLPTGKSFSVPTDVSTCE